MLIIIKINNKHLLTGYKSVRDRIIYDEVWDEKAELLISNKVKESKGKESGKNRGKINSSEMGKS